MAKERLYTIMVRVEFTWENKYGDRRCNWVTHWGNYYSSNPDGLAEYVAANHVVLEPESGEKVKKILYSELSQYTILEVKSV